MGAMQRAVNKGLRPQRRGTEIAPLRANPYDFSGALKAITPQDRFVNPTIRKFLLFGLAGGAGFVVDAGIAYLLVDTPLGFIGARVVSFLCAVATTWLINRSFAFRSQRSDHLPLWREFLHYLAAMLLGGAVNLGVSFALYYWIHPSRELSVLCVAAGVAAGMFVNFLLADKLVFKAGPKTSV